MINISFYAFDFIRGGGGKKRGGNDTNEKTVYSVFSCYLNNL